jgi:hypothetical protein
MPAMFLIPRCLGLPFANVGHFVFLPVENGQGFS